MIETISATGWMVVVSMFWGGTNPLLKHGTSGLDGVKQPTWVSFFHSNALCG